MSSTLVHRSDFLPIARECFSAELASDKNFEIVYTALETSGGEKEVVVCYRMTNPAREGVKNPMGIPETLTFLHKFPLDMAKVIYSEI